MEHRLHRKYVTRDGHEALVYKKRNALLVFRFVYHVHILSKVIHKPDSGYRRDVIYGWSGPDIQKIKTEVENWTLAQMFAQNKYLLQAAVDYRQSHPVK